MAMYWTTTHGRGPAFQSRAERRRRRQNRAARPKVIGRIAPDELTIAQADLAPAGLYSPPWYRRVWRSIVLYFAGSK